MKTTTLLAKPGSATKPKGAAATAAFLAGGVLILWLSYIHFHLWDIGYRHIATIGPLFLLQSIAGLVIGLLVIALRRVDSDRGHRLRRWPPWPAFSSR